MELKRMGNDFTVTLNIKRKGSPEDFTKASGITVVLLHMTCSFIKIVPSQITVNGDKISFPVTADQQKEAGRYRVMLKYHKQGLDGLKTYTVDKCDVFELVPDSCEAETTDTDVIADIDVQIEQDGKDGLSAYEIALLNGYHGTQEEYEKGLAEAPKVATQVARLKRKTKSIRDSMIVVESLDRRVPYNYNKGQTFAFSPEKPIMFEALRTRVSNSFNGFTHNSEFIDTDGVFADGLLLNATYINIKPVKLPYVEEIENIVLYVNKKTTDGQLTSSWCNFEKYTLYDTRMKPISDWTNAVYFSATVKFGLGMVKRISVVIEYKGHQFNYSLFTSSFGLSVDPGLQTFSIRNTPIVYMKGNKCFSVKPVKPTIDYWESDIANCREIKVLRRVKSFHTFANYRYRTVHNNPTGNYGEAVWRYPERKCAGFDMSSLIDYVTAPHNEIFSRVDDTPYSMDNAVLTDWYAVSIPRYPRIRKRLEKHFSKSNKDYTLCFYCKAYNYVLVKGKQIYSEPLLLKLKVEYYINNSRLSCSASLSEG